MNLSMQIVLDVFVDVLEVIKTFVKGNTFPPNITYILLKIGFKIIIVW